MLHIIQKSDFDSQSLNSCLNALSPQDALLLIENGIFSALSDTTSANALSNLAKDQKVFVLAPHAAERGVLERLMADIQLVNFEGFVDLVVQHDLVLRW